MSIEKIVGKLLKFTQKKRRIFDGMIKNHVGKQSNIVIMTATWHNKKGNVKKKKIRSKTKVKRNQI